MRALGWLVVAVGFFGVHLFGILLLMGSLEEGEGDSLDHEVCHTVAWLYDHRFNVAKIKREEEDLEKKEENGKKER